MGFPFLEWFKKILGVTRSRGREGGRGSKTKTVGIFFTFSRFFGSNVVHHKVYRILRLVSYEPVCLLHFFAVFVFFNWFLLVHLFSGLAHWLYWLEVMGVKNFQMCWTARSMERCIFFSLKIHSSAPSDPNSTIFPPVWFTHYNSRS